MLDPTMDQPRPHASLGTDPIRTISRDELRAKLDRGDDGLREWTADLIARRS